MQLGFDLGGTKIELRAFDAQWREVTRDRCATPTDYRDLISAIAGMAERAEAELGPLGAVGIGTAGIIHPTTGVAKAANLAIDGQAFVGDIRSAMGREVTVLNDARAFTLSEAIFGAGRGYSRVAGLVLGTGVGGGVVNDGALVTGPSAIGGEFGHMAAPAHLVVAQNLPVIDCGCGRKGCVETYISGPGLELLARHLAGVELTAPEIAQRRSIDMKHVWMVWCSLVAELLHSLTVAIDPDVIVLGGGLSQIPDVRRDLSDAASQAQISGVSSAPLVSAQGGDASGARGAAYAAWSEGVAG